MSSTGTVQPSVEYINPFVAGVVQTWSTMLGCNPKRGQMKLAPDHQHDNDITALVGLSGPAEGTIALRFPIDTARALSRKMLDDENPGEDDLVDVLLELVNIVGGAAKGKFVSPEPIVLGLPTMIRGTGYRVEHRRGVRWLAVPFECELGAFTLEVAFNPPSKG